MADRIGSPGRAGDAGIEKPAPPHAPFLNSAQRFSKQDSPSAGPAYHVAYQEASVLPEKRTVKGWSSIDDAVKGSRGTSTGKVFSSLAPATDRPAPGSILQPLYTTYPNETRLQELLDLQRRRLGQAPGPGQYEVAKGPQVTKTCFRRQAIPQLDGPFVAPADSRTVLETTRDREMEQTRNRHPGSGLAPGVYNAHLSKDATKKLAPAPKIGTGHREGKTPHVKSLSVSRSIQHGIDWHVPVVIQIKPADGKQQQQQQQQSRGSSPAGGGSPPRSPSGREYSEAEALAAGGDLEYEQQRRHQMKTPPLPPPVGGKAPPPPAAVARSIRSVQAAPGDWDWQKLGHNYRASWTTQGGGAYSHGDRTTARRDAKQPDAVDYMGDHTQSIDPSTLPVEPLAGDIFPIPEEHSESYFMDEAYGDPRQDTAGTSRGSGQFGELPLPPRSGSAGSSSFQGQQYYGAPHLQAPDSAGEDLGGGGGGGGAQEQQEDIMLTSAASLLSRAEIERHEKALQAALLAQQQAARRAAWNQKAGVVV